MTRMINIATKLGADAFVVQTFNGREELGRLYEYNLELLSQKPDIKAEDLLGSNATVSLERHDGQSQRYFNGYITRFSVYGEVPTTAFAGASTGFLYLVTIHPGAWFMTRASNARIYNQTPIGDLVKKLVTDPGLMTIESKLAASETRDFIVQYRETDFNFFSRLAEHAGIYYFFKHENGKHTMVLVDKKGDHAPIDNLPNISFSGNSRDDTTITGFELSSQVQPGAYATGDYNHVTPNSRITAVEPHASGHDNDGFETFDFPADTTTVAFAKTYAQIRGEEASCRYAVGRGAGSEREIQVGFKTTLTDHTVDALNQEYLVVSHSFRASNNLSASGDAASGADFRCEFQCIPASVQFRAARLAPRPTIPGTQTALVVADFHKDTDTGGGDDPIGANIGRVRVQFFWDRYASQSCWARVSTPWAGKTYGFQNMPRVGEEVLVQFLEGDPDRPVVIGRVHNAENMPPFKLPANASITGMKTMSMDASGKSIAGKWNELRFDDKDGGEQVYIQAQKDFDTRVLADKKVSVGGTSHTTVGKDAFHKYGADHHVDTTGDVNEKIGGQLSFDVTQDIHVKSGSKFLVDGGPEVHLKGAQKVVVESSTMVSLVSGGSFINVMPTGIYISGPMVYVNSGGSAGSGTGANPQPPKAATAAMTSEGGAATAPPPKPPAPTAFSPKASSFLLAAKTGAPLVSQSCPG